MMLQATYDCTQLNMLASSNAILRNSHVQLLTVTSVVNVKTDAMMTPWFVLYILDCHCHYDI